MMMIRRPVQLEWLARLGSYPNTLQASRHRAAVAAASCGLFCVVPRLVLSCTP
jgi:hypothetical protein